MNIAAFDLATVTGWAVGAPGQRPLWGARRMGGKPGASPGAVLDDFDGWLDGLLDRAMPLAGIWCEQAYVARGKINPSTVQVLYGLSGILLMHAHRRDVALRSVNISRLSKHFTGFSWSGLGRAEKKAATIRMAKLYGFNVSSDDEADAVALWLMAEAEVAPGLRRASGPLFARAS